MSHDDLALLKLIYTNYLTTGQRHFHVEQMAENTHADTAERMETYIRLKDLSDRKLIETMYTNESLEDYCDRGSIDVTITAKGLALAELL